ncbi:MAG: hypothetical protein M3P99_05150 [Pseudomonadota bacterium]|nr:hypothetical protein [Pseudomonadota bacterium]
MIKFLLGVVVGSVATASYLRQQSRYTPSEYLTGRVDELSSVDNIVADPEVNAGDGSRRRAALVV